VEPALRAWVESQLGGIGAVVDHSWPHGVTRVWRVTAGREIAWVKHHTQERKFRQEQRAYRELVPQLAAAGVRVPTCLADDGARTLLLDHLPGEPARADDPAIHRQAGAVLWILHALPYDDPDPLPLADALRERLARWVQEAEGIIDSGPSIAGFGDAASFDGHRRCWCHRDWSARNWLVEGGRIGVIDFEHTGPDLWLVDLVRLAEGAFDDPEVEHAFFEGYGPMPSDTDAHLRQLLWLTELATVAWSARHGDAAYEAIGRRMLARLSAGWRPLAANRRA
jgi:hypothetical protein